MKAAVREMRERLAGAMVQGAWTVAFTTQICPRAFRVIGFHPLTPF